MNLTLHSIYIFLLVFLGCSEAPVIKADKGIAPKSTRLIVDDGPPDDPTFVNTRDTVSSIGPKSITRNVLQDKSGNIWFATWQGIMMYDGKTFTNVTLKEGLKRFHIFSIYEDRSGKIWFGTVGGGVYCYNPKSDKSAEKTFTYYSTKQGLSSNTVFSVMEDAQANIWLATDNGLSCFNGSSFTNYTTADGLCHNTVYSLVQDNDGKIWIGTEDGINSFSPSIASMSGSLKRKFIAEKQLAFRHVVAMIKDHNGDLLVCSQNGLFRCGKNMQIAITNDFTPNVFEDKHGKLWISRNDVKPPKMALYSYDPVRNGQSDDLVKITAERQVFGVTEDSAGNIWFGTERGVVRYNGKAFEDFSN